MRRRLQYRFTALLLVIAVIGGMCAVVGSRLRFYRQQQVLQQRLDSTGVTPYAPTIHQTDPLTRWLLGEPAFTIDGFVVRYQENMDKPLAEVAAAIGSLQIKGVTLDGCGNGLGGGMLGLTCGSAASLGIVGVKSLENLGVHELHMINIEMSEEAWSNLGRLNHLETLSLPFALRDEDLAKSASLGSLRKLRVPRSYRTDAAKLKAMLPTVAVVQFGPERNPAIERQLKLIRDGKTDNFWLSALPKDIDVELHDALSELRGADLAGLRLTDCPLDQETIASIERLTSLKSLELSNTNVTCEMLIDLLRHLPELAELTVLGCAVDDTIVPSIIKHERLQILTTGEASISEEGLQAIYEQKPDFVGL